MGRAVASEPIYDFEYGNAQPKLHDQQGANIPK
jgi:hypothetical protein